MSSHQREQNPDVNSYNPDIEPGEDPTGSEPNTTSNDIERPTEGEVIPVPPGVVPSAPIEEPPSDENVPVGDVDDSPKQIAG